MNRLDALLAEHPFVVLDGGLATQLANRGHRLGDPLWSTRVLLDDPGAVEKVHRDYFEAGADCATTATYQGSVAQYLAEGDEALGEALRLGVAVARRAANAVQAARPGFSPLVIGSLGSFGASLADGSEYTGDFGPFDDEVVLGFHRHRLQALAPRVDAIAFETIPSLREAQIIARLLAESAIATPVWVAFTCRDGRHTAAGDPLAACAAVVAPWVWGLGINCSTPGVVTDALEYLGTLTDRPLCAYPNGGERWDPKLGRYAGEVLAPAAYANLARRWWQAGARVIGGCCRTTPAHILALAQLRGTWGS